ncbi:MULTISPECIES: ABC transporter permease [unclassified Mucilaginibacter]|uniref:ABC transporter permease n=1 Tax=unclassified Mucilaginibacter TaxID=2617802 RepID=UPI002AC9E27D|nr:MULTISPECIES: ABC transporter permease [unclassified Mucilaginibacter]MEB0260989.1 ABC transporter permease [Mucilaginibacter sp. 10I4]MEB0279584.1 ABC transporter permease [Mucilaginibacter sp. 10B2]MEB0300353.1 ABC transporter permease [Mucilaginibacter sp. 5C4]WPX22548.1 FtsX-like permease family protein [Mucilaginibacter sp. 5C4]
MIINQLKFAFKNLIRTKIFTAINICGLVVSLIAVILMSLYIENELSYDRYNKQANDIYRVVDDKQTNALTQHGAGSPGPMAPLMLNDFPQVKQAVRIISGEALVKYEDKLFEEKHLYFADPAIFKVFDLPMISGNGATALVNPMCIVITESVANKYFGKVDAVGKSLLINGENLKVTGIIKDLPANSHISFDILVSMATAIKKDSGYDWMFTNWYSNNFYTYVVLPPNYDAKNLTKQFDAFADRHKANTASTRHHYNLEKLTDIYLHSDRENQAGKVGNITNLCVFSAIALFVLIIACINFINLSTARSAERAKEIGIKKVNGVNRSGLITQFFIESFLTVGVALIIAVFAACLLMPAFNTFAGKSIVFEVFKPLHLALLLSILMVVSVLSGSYPAFVLSGFNPIAALKGTLRSSSFSVGVRKGLVVFQFAISIILIISSIVVYSQLQFMQKHDLGFKPSQTLILNFEGDGFVKNQLSFITNELLHINGVKAVTASSDVPGNLTSGAWSMEFAKKTGDTVHAELPIYLTDFNFMKQYHIPMVAGRGLSPLFAADTVESMIINEAALRKLGFKNADDAIGVKVGMYPNDGRIIGVYKDFNFESLQKAIGPLAMRVIPNKFRVFSVEISSTDVKKTVVDIETLWKKIVPQRPLEYSFLNEKFNQQYQAEIKFSQLFGLFTMLAIGIACFGLFGLALFSVKQRRKEIGIRKVIGASVVQITALLSIEFVSLVIIAIVIACPVALFIMSKWIQAFAYRIEIGWWVFVNGSLTAITIALITISYQAVRAAIANPVKSLRSE